MKKLPNRGAIFIISVWILTLLALMAVGLAYRISLELRLADYDVGRLQLFYLMQGGLRQAAAVLQEDGLEADSFQDAWAIPTDPKEPVPLGEGSFFLTIEDEAARPNLNSVDQETLMRVPGMEESVASSLRVWRGDQDLSSSVVDQEEAYYRSLTPPLEREKGPIQSLEELALVRGMTPSLAASLQSLFTVYGSKKINVNTASEETFALLGLEESIAHELVRYRLGEDGEAGTEDDHVFQVVDELASAELFEALSLTPDLQLKMAGLVSQMTVQSDHFRVRCKTVAKNGMAKTVVAVIQRTPKSPAVIKYWHEED